MSLKPNDKEEREAVVGKREGKIFMFKDEESVKKICFPDGFSFKFF